MLLCRECMPRGVSVSLSFFFRLNGWLLFRGRQILVHVEAYQVLVLVLGAGSYTGVWRVQGRRRFKVDFSRSFP